ncbi:hypothetical protein D5086_005085, partial [Populus alba]
MEQLPHAEDDPTTNSRCYPGKRHPTPRLPRCPKTEVGKMGRKAQLNFPEELDDLPVPSTCTARDIQAAAAKAAHSVLIPMTKSGETNNGGGSDGEVAGDDFWGEIELPELLLSNSGYSWDSCGWNTTLASDHSTWQPDGEGLQPSMA